jgi:hypothetical protein
MLDNDRYRVASSAYNIALQRERQFGKSLVYIIKIKDPRTDPCGNQHFMPMVVDVVLASCLAHPMHLGPCMHREEQLISLTRANENRSWVEGKQAPQTSWSNTWLLFVSI